MCPEDKSLMYTEIGDSLVGRPIEQQEEYSWLRSTALSWVSWLSQHFRATFIKMLQTAV